MARAIRAARRGELIVTEPEFAPGSVERVKLNEVRASCCSGHFRVASKYGLGSVRGAGCNCGFAADRGDDDAEGAADEDEEEGRDQEIGGPVSGGAGCRSRINLGRR